MTDGSASRAVLRSLLDHVPRHLIQAAGNGIWQGDIDHIDAMGEARVLRSAVTSRRGAHLPGGGSIGLVAHDVTTARSTAATLRHRASQDSLTGLANRRQILTLLAHAIGEQRGRPGLVAAIFVDFERRSESVGPQDRVARIGGDEFLIVCGGLTDPTEAVDLAERARRALTGRLRLRQLDLSLSVSVGVALCDDDLRHADDMTVATTLVSNADTAMYEAKSARRGPSVLFTPAMRSAARERAELAADLVSAIRDLRLRIDFQPVFSTVTHRVVGAEALVRWDHPDRGQLDPLEFISVAEEAGSIGELVLDQALLETRLWIERQVVDDGFAVHVNVSTAQLASATFVNPVMGRLHSHGVRPEQLVLEARETALLGRNTDVDRSVAALRRLGARIAIDNFGAGANALSVLTEIGADVLKLDGALGLPLGSSDANTRVVRAVVLLAHALGMSVVAQRVSDVDQLRHLRVAGCDAVQGNLPAPAGWPQDLVTSAQF